MPTANTSYDLKQVQKINSISNISLKPIFVIRVELYVIKKTLTSGV